MIEKPFVSGNTGEIADMYLTPDAITKSPGLWCWNINHVMSGVIAGEDPNLEAQGCRGAGILLAETDMCGMRVILQATCFASRALVIE